MQELKGWAVRKLISGKGKKIVDGAHVKLTFDDSIIPQFFFTISGHERRLSGIYSSFLRSLYLKTSEGDSSISTILHEVVVELHARLMIKCMCINT